MSSNSSEFPILNPQTPLAFLDPSTATQYEASRYVYVAALGALCWDILSSSGQDYQLLTKHRFTLPTLAYFVSRISTLLFLTTSTVFQVGTPANCETLEIIIGIAYVFSLSSTSFLFFVRVRAVFDSSRLITSIFFILWVCNCGVSVVVPIAIGGVHIADTAYCINSALKSLAAATLIMSTVHDTLVFVAISWKLLGTTTVSNSNIKTLVGGRGLPRISRMLLRSGQQYYLFTVGGNIIAMTFILIPTIPPIIRAIFSVPNVALENAMACRVYRSVKFGLIHESLSQSTRSGSFWNNPGRMGGIGSMNANTGETFSLEPSAFGHGRPKSRLPEFNMQVTKPREEDDDIPLAYDSKALSTESGRTGHNVCGEFAV